MTIYRYVVMLLTLAPLAVASVVDAQPVFTGGSIDVAVGVEYERQLYEVRGGIGLGLHVMGPVEFHTAVYHYLDPISNFDKLLQIDVALRLWPLKYEGPLSFVYVGGGVAIQHRYTHLFPDSAGATLTHALPLLLGGATLPRSLPVRPFAEIRILDFGRGRHGAPRSGEVAFYTGMSIPFRWRTNSP